MEYKAGPAEFKADATAEGQYEGYFSIFGNIDDGLDIIEQGAFAKTIQERGRRIKVFMGHDWAKLIGPPPDVLQEDSKGLYAKGRLTIKSFWGRETWELMKDGAMTEGSIGFETIPDKVSWMDNSIRRLKELKLYELSPVPLGMNPLTDVQAIKSLRGMDSVAYLEALQAFLQDVKAGARHSKADVAALNQIVTLALQLGATNATLAAEPPTDTDPEDAGKSLDAAASRAAYTALTVSARLRAAGLALALNRS
jgi:HK97 family phage prohead protease